MGAIISAFSDTEHAVSVAISSEDFCTCDETTPATPVMSPEPISTEVSVFATIPLPMKHECLERPMKQETCLERPILERALWQRMQAKREAEKAAPRLQRRGGRYALRRTKARAHHASLIKQRNDERLLSTMGIQTYLDTLWEEEKADQQEAMLV